MNARHFYCRGCVDRFDAAVGDRAAENLGMQHAGKSHGVGIFGAAGHLLARFDARQRPSDLMPRASMVISAPLRCRRAPGAMRAARRPAPARVCKRAEPRTSEMHSTTSAAASPAREIVLSSMAAPASVSSAAVSRMAFSVAALTTTRADLMRDPVLLERDRHADCRPILGRPGGDLHIGGARFALRRDTQLARSTPSSAARFRNTRQTGPQPQCCARRLGR